MQFHIGLEDTVELQSIYHDQQLTKHRMSTFLKTNTKS